MPEQYNGRPQKPTFACMFGPPFAETVSTFILVIAILPMIATAQTLKMEVKARPDASQPFEFIYSIDTQHASVIQGSSDLMTWINVQTNNPGSSDFIDFNSIFFPSRFYRVLYLNADTPQTGIPNSVFMAGEGFDTVQFAPSGTLGLIFWRGRELVYNERLPTGAWNESRVCMCGTDFTPGDREEYLFQPFAVLLYDAASRPHVLRVAGASIVHAVRQSNGQWSEQETIRPQNAGSSFVLFVAAMGRNDTLHLATISSGSSPLMAYGSNKSGSWQWSQPARLTGNVRGFLRQGYAPRYFSLAVDSQNYAHIAYTPEFRLPRNSEGHLRPYSELWYASNRSGQWLTERVYRNQDDSGDAGTGASVAIDANGQPAIANWRNERASTGSSQESELLFHRRGSDGRWTTSSVATSPDGYQAGDGPKGTGFAPYLRFDSGGRPHIAFSDHAAEHFSSGQNEFAGQIRHAYHDGRKWVLSTVLKQTNPLKHQILYPAFALSDTEAVFMAVDRETDWQAPRFRTAISTYRYVFVTVQRK